MLMARMARFRHLGERATYVRDAAAAIATQPGEGVERTIERVAEWRDIRRRDWEYETVDAVDRALPELLGACDAYDPDGFEEVWEAALRDLRAQGLATGRSAFGGWDDADPRLAWLAWVLTRHLRPEFVVETGVARGLTTRVVLEAMGRNGLGRLWSIDLPPLIRRELAQETGAAVPAGLRDRWTLLVGSSRRMLAGLVDGLPRVDLFVHDSMHTTRNVRFELDRVWPVLRSGGAVLVDDVEKNRATAEFLSEHPFAPSLICRAEDASALIGVVIKPAS
jgi:predicted O-methyltransferase YrrM